MERSNHNSSVVNSARTDEDEDSTENYIFSAKTYHQIVNAIHQKLYYNISNSKFKASNKLDFEDVDDIS